MAYLLDANVFIQAKNMHYDMEICPAFWDWLLREHGRGVVLSIAEVGHELAHGEDALTEWAAARGARFFLPPDPQVISAINRVANWFQSQTQYETAAASTFLGRADHLLVAHALAHGHTVVTHERAADSRRIVKIPNPCNALGVPCITPFQMLREERARFVLSPNLDRS